MFKVKNMSHQNDANGIIYITYIYNIYIYNIYIYIYICNIYIYIVSWLRSVWPNSPSNFIEKMKSR